MPPHDLPHDKPSLPSNQAETNPKRIHQLCLYCQKVVEWKTGQLTLDQAGAHAKVHGGNTFIEF
jgi:hypothetical protein